MTSPYKTALERIESAINAYRGNPTLPRGILKQFKEEAASNSSKPRAVRRQTERARLSRNITCPGCHATISVDIPTDRQGIPKLESHSVSCPRCRLGWLQDLLAYYGRRTGWISGLTASGFKYHHFFVDRGNGVGYCICAAGGSSTKGFIPRKPQRKDMCKECLRRVQVRIDEGSLPSDTHVGKPY